MKTELSSMDLYYLLKEFKILETSKVDQIYQSDEEFLFQFHRTGEGKIMLKVNLPSMIFITQYKSEQPPTPPGFCQFLRRRLKNARLQSIEQLGFERILKLSFTTKETNYLMFIELFSNGNVILTDENLKIISPLKTGNWKDRTIRGGIKYTFPSRINPLELTKEEIKEIIDSSDKESIVKILAIDFGFGGEYAEKICELANIDKNSKTSEGIFESIQKLKEISPKFENYSSFNEFLDETLTTNKIKSMETQQNSKKEKALKKVQAMIDQQRNKIKELEEKIDLNQKIGEAIYTHYQFIQEVLKEPEKYGKVNKKDKTVTIELK